MSPRVPELILSRLDAGDGVKLKRILRVEEHLEERLDVEAASARCGVCNLEHQVKSARSEPWAGKDRTLAPATKR